MRLPKYVENALRKHGVHVYYVDRGIAGLWTKRRSEGELRFYTGWYWNRSNGRKVVETDASGPFKCWSAAARDAFVRLQLRFAR